MLVEIARRISEWRPHGLNHARFEEWCARAVLGDLSPDQLTDLELHIAKCASCRTRLEDAAQSGLELMPALWEKRKPAVSVMPPEGMRARFLQRLKQGDVPPETLSTLELELHLGPAAQRENQAGKLRSHSAKWALRLAAAVLLSIGLLASGYYVGVKSDQQKSATTAHVAVLPTDDQASRSGVASPPPQDNAELLLRTVLADLNRERSLAATDRRALEERLVASDAKLMSLERDQSKNLQDNQAAERELHTQIEASRAETEVLRRKLAERDSILESLQHRTIDLQTELESARHGLQAQDDQRLAKGQLSDLVTARNLHIVDVYDADGRGRRRSSFGRVFYVEGKSLLFYAYDLQDTRTVQADVVFHVWGGRAGTKEVTHSLGILRNEDAHQGVWTMTFDDPSVLAQINSVFVTAESAGRKDLAPHGKKVLYAYLGNPPNHP